MLPSDSLERKGADTSLETADDAAEGDDDDDDDDDDEELESCARKATRKVHVGASRRARRGLRAVRQRA